MVGEFTDSSVLYGGVGVAVSGNLFNLYIVFPFIRGAQVALALKLTLALC